MASTLPSISLADWHASGDTFLFRDHRIFYRESGKGPDLLVIHGFPTCGWDWAWVEPTISKLFKMIIPDMLDYGASHNGSASPASIFDQADMMEALLAHKKITEVDLLIHDVGDTVGQELLARRQKGVLSFTIRSVVFLNGGMVPDHHRPRRIQKILAGPFGWLIVHLIGKKKMIAGLSAIFGKDTQPDAALGEALWHAVIGVNGKAALARRIRYMNERRVNAKRWVGALNQPDLPMMLINGLADPISGAHMAKAFAETAPHARINRLEGIGHFPQIEAPEDVANGFLDFHERMAS